MKPSICTPNCAKLTSTTVRWMRPSATWLSRPSRAGVRNATAQPIATAYTSMARKLSASNSTSVRRPRLGSSAKPWASMATRRPPATSATLPPSSINTSTGASMAICATPTICGVSRSTIATSQANSTFCTPCAANQVPVARQ